MKTPMNEPKRVSYPYIGIVAAISHIEKLKSSAGYNEIPISTAVEKMGFSTKSSSADRVVSALIGYGLISQRGVRENKLIKLSQLSRKLLLYPEGSPERLAEMRTALLNDDMMQKVIEQWPETLPSKEVVQRTLQLPPYYFSERAAIKFTAVINENYEAAILVDKNSEAEFAESDDDAPEQAVIDLKDRPQKNEPKLPSSEDSTTEAVLLLDGGRRRVVLQTPINLSEDEFDYIVEWVKFQKRGLVAKYIPE